MPSYVTFCYRKPCGLESGRILRPVPEVVLDLFLVRFLHATSTISFFGAHKKFPTTKIYRVFRTPSYLISVTNHSDHGGHVDDGGKNFQKGKLRLVQVENRFRD